MKIFSTKNEDVVMGKIFIFGRKIKKGPHMIDNIIWVKETPNLASSTHTGFHKTFVKKYFDLSLCVVPNTYIKSK